MPLPLGTGGIMFLAYLSGWFYLILVQFCRSETTQIVFRKHEEMFTFPMVP